MFGIHIPAYVWVGSFPSRGYNEVFKVTYLNCPFQSGHPLPVNCLSGLVPLILPFQCLEGEDPSLESVSSCIWSWISVVGRLRWKSWKPRGPWPCFGCSRTWDPNKPLWRRRMRGCSGEPQRGWRIPVPGSIGGENSNHEGLLEKRRQPQAEIKSKLVHESAYTFGLQGGNNQTGNSYKRTLFLSASFSYFFYTNKIMMFPKNRGYHKVYDIPADNPWIHFSLHSCFRYIKKQTGEKHFELSQQTIWRK